MKGITFDKRSGKWRVRLSGGKKEKWVGLFVCLKEAASAYNRAAKELYGEFAYQNNI